MTSFTIRKARIEDSSVIARLITQLSYPTTSEQMEKRLELLADELSHRALVAEAGNEIVGFISARLDLGFEYDGLQARILALVVYEKMRGKGIGRALVAKVETWARSRGAHKMMVNTHQRRTKTHEFYRSLGFESTGLRFVKPLNP